MMLRVDKYSGTQVKIPVSLRCPSCRQNGAFESLSGVTDLQLNSVHPQIIVGQRRCPDPTCYTHVLFIYQGGRVVAAYPAERIDFDSTALPTAVLKALEEAIACHASQCFVAAAIMVRKTLEELCSERDAKGANLKERLKQLGAKVILPQELLDGLDNLRLLGNDAAHIESQHYNQVGAEEVEVAIEVTKEVLKAVYQYSALMQRLKDLKKPTT